LVPLIDEHRDLLTPDPEVEANPEAHYDRVVRLDLSTLEPHVAGPHSPDRARPISQFAAEVADRSNGFIDAISAALIGSCTNSSYEDMSRAAAVAQQGSAHGIRAAAALMVTPGSEQVRATIARDGQMQALRDIGATVLANACGPCIGQWRRANEFARMSNTIVTSYNRNFPRRNDGYPTTMNFIASPELVTAFALAGRLSFNPLTDTLTDRHGRSIMLTAPKPAPEVPAQGFARRRAAYIPPAKDGRNIELRIDANSERLQLLAPWPAWGGSDFLDMPLLLKSKGKTTTDQISPAGPWLRYRGHLDKFSDNMFLGATNAFTGKAGSGRNILSGEADQPFANIARDYRSRGTHWVVVGDFNYGEGSSREHAALSPRLLGGAAIIARSFARIHESNLKKQGLLALTFQLSDDYDRIREDDRISLVGLADLAPGRPMTCIIRHADGATETLNLAHSFSASQLEWFRAGSALNVTHAGQRSLQTV
jgi:aconitate hydratase